MQIHLTNTCKKKNLTTLFKHLPSKNSLLNIIFHRGMFMFRTFHAVLHLKLFAYWEIAHTVSLSADLSAKINFLKTSLWNTIRVANSFDPDKIRPSVLSGLVWAKTICKHYQKRKQTGKCQKFLQLSGQYTLNEMKVAIHFLPSINTR